MLHVAIGLINTTYLDSFSIMILFCLNIPAMIVNDL